MRQGAELRNRQTGTGNKQINELTADPSQNGWFINYKKPALVERLIEQEMHSSPISMFWRTN